MAAGRNGTLTAAALTLLVVVGCAAPSATGPPNPPPTSSAPSSAAPAQPSPTSTPTVGAGRTSRPSPTTTPKPVLASDGKPREARLSVPALRLKGLRVRPYRGTPDDARGTRIQNGGLLASPYGSGGRTGVGGIGNYLVTGHRTSSTEPFRRLPRLKKGDEVHLVAGGKRYTYEITATRITSFRSKKSLAQQSAAVPGKVGLKPTRAMITLSTCRTPEDHAEGNYWADRFDNPEHRIDKIGVLVRISTA